MILPKMCIRDRFGMDEYEFAVHETKTYEVIEDVRNFKSEIGILYLNDFNRKVLTKLFACLLYTSRCV